MTIKNVWRERLQDFTTYQWAWEKVRAYLKAADVWYDEVAMTEFEFGLDGEVERIMRDLLAGEYRMERLRLAAQPKGTIKETAVRQTFTVSFRDQLAWSALLIAIGPELDAQMPAWSYGARLYRAMVRDDDASMWRSGPYRQTRGLTYRPFAQSWGLFRRCAYLTARRIGQGKDRWQDDLGAGDEMTREMVEQSPSLLLPYLDKRYWKLAGNGELFYCSIDLKKFFPMISLNSVRLNIVQRFPNSDKAPLDRLLRSMLVFPVDTSSWDAQVDESLLTRVESGRLLGLPTGLIVSGFLANMAMIDVDDEVNKLAKRYQVAHFRYVDDHVLLSNSFDRLVKWVKKYQDLLREKKVGVEIGTDKTTPAPLRDYLSGSGKLENARSACKLDPEFPSPLMTGTLARISALAEADFALMGGTEQRNMLADLEHLLVTPLPDTEIREDTRMAFAATKLSRLVPQSRLDPAPLATASWRVITVTNELAKAEKELESLTKSSRRYKLTAAAIDSLNAEVKIARDEQEAKLRAYHMDKSGLAKRALSLLCKALRDHPDKIRVWERAVELCAAAGAHQGIFLLTIKAVCEANEKAAITAPYLLSQIMRWYARELIRHGRIVADEETAADDLLESRKFLLGFVKSSLSEYLLRQRRYGAHYLGPSQALLRLALGVVREVLTPPAKQNDKSLLARLNRLNAANWSSVRSVHLTPDWDPVAAVVWADEYWRLPQDIKPSPVWARSKGWVPKHTRYLWEWCEPFPQDTPPAVIKHVSRAKGATRSNRAGWVADSVANTSSRKQHAMKRGQLLANWWTNLYQTPARAPDAPTEPPSADPRASEWTALEIAKQAAALVGNEPPGQPVRLEAHPYNLIVPHEWTTKPQSWEQWKATVHASPLQATSIGNRVQDYRYVVGLAKDPDWQAVCRLGVLLAYLLRQGRPWPAYWGVASHRPARTKVLWQLIADIACSSWSTAILESCLLPRKRETMLLQLLFQLNAVQSPTDDTTHEPPLISSPGDIESAARVAQLVLEQHQLLLRDSLPRQLTPVRFEQLRGSTWTSLEPQHAQQM